VQGWEENVPRAAKWEGNCPGRNVQIVVLSQSSSFIASCVCQLQ